MSSICTSPPGAASITTRSATSTRPATSGLGWHVYTPLELAPRRFVWVNRGFVPDARKAPQSRSDGQMAGEVEVRGLVRMRRRPRACSRPTTMWRTTCGIGPTAPP